jgi:transposase
MSETVVHGDHARAVRSCRTLPAQAARQREHDQSTNGQCNVVRSRASRAHQDRGGVAGQHQYQGAPRWHRRSKKNGPQAIGKSRGGWNTKVHMVAANARTAVTFCLSPGQAHDAPEGRRLLESLGATSRPIHLLMDRAYEGNETRQLALDLGFIPVVPPMKTRVEPWDYDREMYKRRNEVERLFRRLKGFRRIFSRFEKLDAMFLGFLSFVLVADGLRDLC